MIVLRSRPGARGGLEIDAEPYRPHPSIANLYLPCDATLEPPLRRDRVRELLVPDHDDVAWLTGNGIASGFPDGTFRPKDPVLRQQMARFLRNYNNRITIHRETTDPASNTIFTAHATCPPGDRALAGGGHADLANLFIYQSVPLPANTWYVYWISENGVTVNPAGLSVWVVCGPDDETS